MKNTQEIIIKNERVDDIPVLLGVMDQIGLSSITLNMFVKYYSLEIDPWINYIEPIKKAIEEGARSASEISDKTGLSVYTIYKCNSHTGIKLSELKRSKRENIILIRKLLREKRVASIEEAADYLGLSRKTGRTYYNQYNQIYSGQREGLE